MVSEQHMTYICITCFKMKLVPLTVKKEVKESILQHKKTAFGTVCIPRNFVEESAIPLLKYE